MKRVAVVLLAAIAIILSRSCQSKGQLLVHFYGSSCPRAETIVAQAVLDAQKQDTDIPAKLLRLLFHDCFVRGCDGSVLLDSTSNSTTEKDARASATLGGFEVIDQAKSVLEDVCKSTVSCADILALAARDAIMAAGGPTFDIPTGRLDGLVSLASEVSANIPDPASKLDSLLMTFEAKGLSQTDLVALLGGHTIGVARCGAFSDRFNTTNGSMVATDPTLDPSFAQSLEAACPTSSAGVAVPLDALTSTQFDAAYYRNLEQGKGLLTVDEILFTDSRTKGQVQIFAGDQSVFFANFPLSFIKMSSIAVKTGAEGQIRANCRVVNPA